jgi:Tfp pilus assembly protein PilO
MAIYGPSNQLQTSLIETVALIVVIVLVGWFLVLPKHADLREQKAQLKQQQTAYSNIQKDTEDLNRLIGQMKQAKTDLTLVDEALPLDNRPTKLEVLLDSLVTASGMKLSAMNIQTAETGIAAGNKSVTGDPYGADRKLQTTSLELITTGTVDQFRNLLQLIETNGRIIDVSDLQLSNEQETTTYTIKLKAYSYVP